MTSALHMTLQLGKIKTARKTEEETLSIIYSVVLCSTIKRYKKMKLLNYTPAETLKLTLPPKLLELTLLVDIDISTDPNVHINATQLTSPDGASEFLC